MSFETRTDFVCCCRESDSILSTYNVHMIVNMHSDPPLKGDCAIIITKQVKGNCMCIYGMITRFVNGLN